MLIRLLRNTVVGADAITPNSGFRATEYGPDYADDTVDVLPGFALQWIAQGRAVPEQARKKRTAPVRGTPPRKDDSARNQAGAIEHGDPVVEHGDPDPPAPPKKRAPRRRKSPSTKGTKGKK